MSAAEYLPYRTLLTRTSVKRFPDERPAKSYGSHGAFTSMTRKANLGAYLRSRPMAGVPTRHDVFRVHRYPGIFIQ
jgi:hypothetical protein